MRSAASAVILSGLYLWGCTAGPPLAPPNGPPVALPAPVSDTPRGAETSPQPSAPFQVVRITPQEVRARMDRGESLLIADVRGPGSYDLTHIEGAVSLPGAEVQEWAPKLDKEQTIVFY